MPPVLRRPTITDARGRKVPLLPHEMLLPGLTDPQRRERLERAGWHGGPQALGRRAPIIIAVLVLTVLVFAVAPMIIAQRLLAPSWVQMSLAVLPAVVSTVGGIFWTRRLASSAIAKVYLRARYCPSCGYDLTSAQRDVNHLTTCPECGAAWKLSTTS